MFTHSIDPHTWLTLHDRQVAAGSKKAAAEADANVIQRRALVRRRPPTEVVHLQVHSGLRECAAGGRCAA